MKHPLLPVLILTLICGPAHQSLAQQGASDVYYQEGQLKYEDHIYKEGIRTVKLHPRSDPMAMPIIKLGGSERLFLSFDDLYADYMNMSYTLIHCNADWTPSNLLKQEYLNGVQEAYIENYTYSINALLPYTHYRLQLPNQDMSFSKSGNYLLKVYVSGDENDLILTRRLMVYEDRVSVGGEVKRPTRVELMNDHQQVNFSVSHSGYHIQDPFQELKVHLLQNQRWDNAITDLKPRFMQGKQLLYNYDKENTFPGGNEFRFFDLKNMQALSQNIARIDRDSVFTAYLLPSQPRSIANYSVQFDINGQFVVRRLDASDSDTEADYIYVDFLLKYPEPHSNSDVFLFGRFTDWKLLPEYKMQYDPQRQSYRKRILLKQGYYNYMFAVLDNKTLEADLELMEGNHWETENDYQVLVYNREVGQRFDRLIGFGRFSSDNLYGR